jgi:hypothetical protein
MNEIQFSVDDVARMLRINSTEVLKLSEKGKLRPARKLNGAEYYRAEDLYNFVMEHIFFGTNYRTKRESIADDQVIRFIIHSGQHQMMASVCFWCVMNEKKAEAVKLLYALAVNGMSLTHIIEDIVHPVFRRIASLHGAKKIRQDEKNKAVFLLEGAVITFLEAVSSQATCPPSIPPLQLKLLRLYYSGKSLWRRMG